MTKSYAQLQATIAKLEKQAAALRAAETTKVVAQIKESIATFGLTVEQLFGRGAKVSKPAASKALAGGKMVRKGAGVPKYRHPKTGKTWTGFGKAPGWIATVRNRDKFLIDQSGLSAATPSVEEAAAPVAQVAPVARKGARKARAVAAPVKTAMRTKKVAVAAAEVAAPEAQAGKATAKKAATRKGAASKKVAPAKKVTAKAAKSLKTPAKKAAAVKSQHVAKTRSARANTKAAAPETTGVASANADTVASAN